MSLEVVGRASFGLLMGSSRDGALDCAGVVVLDCGVDLVVPRFDATDCALDWLRATDGALDDAGVVAFDWGLGIDSGLSTGDDFEAFLVDCERTDAGVVGDGATVVGDGTTDGTTDDPLDTGDGASGGSGDPTCVARDGAVVPPPSPWVSLATSKALFPGSFCDLDLDLADGNEIFAVFLYGRFGAGLSQRV